MAKRYRVLKDCYIGDRLRSENTVVMGSEFSGAVPDHLELIPESPVEREEQVPNATVSAMELAEEAGIDINDVTGTGANGTITKPDVQGHIDAQGS